MFSGQLSNWSRIRRDRTVSVDHIIQGKHFCLFEILDKLRARVGSPSIILYEECPESWKMEGFVGEEVTSQLIQELIALLGMTDAPLREWTYRTAGPGLTEPVFLVTVHAPLSSQDAVKRHVIAFVRLSYSSRGCANLKTGARERPVQQSMM